ncbi:sensory box sensor histidine kinase/response regulator [Parvularcula bermudensis HTCC2503]|uniref:histidine kinase n=1 Tax=Parvularcula bermudensis (strain ATCC BAA-594 / HTCC2503 / KCTC 12087) TaxID=314260 RepID=E0TBZ7_PARBH|nr:ATP-binding protein [Parvularcula bermudensis]ADM08490.1 sensory box sensor histidine kinase/response regulator [Parvularcula bermudensis HTCC2503]
MAEASTQLRASFDRRYLLAIALLTAAAVANFTLSYIMASLDTDRAHVFNLVTAQETGAQRVANLASNLIDPNAAEDIAATREALRTTIDRMRDVHETLIGKGAGKERIARYIEPLDDIFGSGRGSFEGRIRDFFENAETIAQGGGLSDAQRALAVAVIDDADSILRTHNLMALVLEEKARQQNRFEKLLHVGALVSMCLALCLVTIFIFRPMASSIEKAVDNLEGAKATARHAEEAATQANRARGDFLQAASHELKTPLNAILGMTDAIRDKKVKGIEVELEQIIAAGDHLLTILNNILDTHRLSEGKLKLEHRDFSLSEAIAGPLARARAAALAKGIDFQVENKLPADLSVVGDARRIEQVVTNLLDNAVKFTENGSVKFDAGISAEKDKLADIYMKIVDTGIGIEQERLRQIFERFSTEGSMLTRNGGLGVGLALAREIVRSMGGEIEVKSDIGLGTSFAVHIPMPVSNEPHQSAPANPASDRNIHENNGRPLNILIVDDNLANRMVAEALVKPLGATTQSAADGRQAVDMASKERFDIIFMDISMPVMDGMTATKMIRASDGPNAQTPIVALTAHMGTAEWDEIRRAGLDDILNKPVRRDMIVKCLDKWTKAPVDEAISA